MKITDKNNDDSSFYDLEEATEVVWNNVPQYLRDKYTHDDIYFILEAELDYLESVGVLPKEDEEPPICDYPVNIDQEAMEKYIVERAIKNDIFLTYDEWDDIMEAELIYYKMNDALGDMGEFWN